MSSEAARYVTGALAILKGLGFVMGRRDKAYDIGTKQAVELLEKARASLAAELGSGPAPEVEASAGLEPSIVEWIYSASENALRAADLMAFDAQNPTRVEVLAGALLSIREWAARQMPAEKLPPPSGEEPLQLR